MKKFLILLFFTCIFANQAAAVDGQPGNVELDLFPGEQNEEEITLIDQAKTILEVGRYFDKILLKGICRTMSANFFRT